MILAEVFQNLLRINSISPLRKMISWPYLHRSSWRSELAELRNKGGKKGHFWMETN
jgi:hypothetical protein